MQFRACVVSGRAVYINKCPTELGEKEEGQG